MLIGGFVVLALAAFGIVAYALPGEKQGEAPPGPPASGSASVEPEADPDSALPASGTEPDAPQLARLEIHGPKGAAVLIDGEPQGALPLETQLPAGQHRVEVRSPDHEPWQIDAELVAGANPPIVADLVERAPAETSPASARAPKPKPKSSRSGPTAQAAPSQPSKPPDSAPSKPPKPPLVEKPAPRMDDDDVFLPVGKKK
jgi:hypothetical protein